MKKLFSLVEPNEEPSNELLIFCCFPLFFRLFRRLLHSTKEPVYREEEEAFLSWFVSRARSDDN